jgi:hypothetical protein
MNIVEYAQLQDMIPAHRYEKSQQAWQICRDLNLAKIYNKVGEDAALKENPYHNIYHTHCMVVNADEAVKWYNRKEVVITPQEHAELITACLYHDISHSAGKFNDTANVALAITSVRAAGENGDLWAPNRGFDLRVQEICDIVAVTEYPFIRTPTTLCQQIIRDCDLLQSLEPDWMEMIFVGLFAELKNKPEFSNMTVEQFIPLQIKFLEGAEFFTEWFEKNKRKQWKEAIKNVKRSMQ